MKLRESRVEAGLAYFNGRYSGKTNFGAFECQNILDHRLAWQFGRADVLQFANASSSFMLDYAR